MACDLDSASETVAGSNSRKTLEGELNEVCPLPSDFQDVSHNPLMRIAYRELVPNDQVILNLAPNLREIKGISPTLFKGLTSP